MSNPNLPLGIALVCGAAACAITCAVTDLGAGVGVSLGAVVAGASLIFQGQQQKPAEQREEKESKKESKKSKGKKPVKKQANTPSPRAPTSPEPAEKKKSEKPKKDSAPKSPPQKSPAPKSQPQQTQQTQQKAKSPQKPPTVETEQKEPTKTQLQKAKKKQKKEAEEKAKAEEKALEAKREQAQAKKAAKAAQKKKEKEIVSPQVQAQASDVDADDEDVKEEEVLEDGWEKPKPRNTVRIRSPKDIKKAKDAAVARSKGPSSEESKVVVEVRVPKHKHGSIIGQKGAFLTLIQEKTGATVTMPKREGGGLGVVISGSAAQVKEAEQVVRDIANKGYSSLTHPGLESNELLLKDEKQIGRIAGKGGVYLKAIQEKSGASLQLPDRKSAQPSNKIIILGKSSEITNAKLALMDLMRQGYCEYTHPGWITEEFDFNSDYLGRLIGPGGSKISELSRAFDVKIDTPKQDDPSSTSKQDIIVIKGTQSNIDRAKEAIAELLSQTEVTEEIPAPDPNDPWQQDPVEPEW